MSEKLNFDKNWKFYLGDLSPKSNTDGWGGAKARAYSFGATAFDARDEKWRDVDLPHDFVSEGDYTRKTADVAEMTAIPEMESIDSRHFAGGNLAGGIAWYRKRFTIPADKRNKRIYIYFDGIFRDSTVYLNEYYIGRHESGYTGFYYDITDFINYSDENVIAVRVDSRDAEQMKKYIMGGAGSHPNELACREFYVPLVTKKLRRVLGDEPTQLNNDIYIMIGQSNMAGRAEVEKEHLGSVNNAYLLNSYGEWEKARNIEVSANSSNQDFGYNRYSTIRKQGSAKSEYQGISLSYSFSQKMGKYCSDKGKTVGLVVNARGGSEISEWIPDSEYYNEAVKRANEAVENGGEIKGIIWHQGESDVSKGTDLEDYMDMLTNMVDELRRELNAPDAVFVAGQIRQEKISDKGTHSTNAFNDKIKEVSTYIDNSAWVSSEGLTDVGDTLHFNAESQIILGERYAEKIIELLEK